jgi:serine/threonine protein phosphatase 1
MQLQKNFHNVYVLKGNHEEMMLEAYEKEDEFSHWLSNGGDTTYSSYCKNARISWENFNKEFPVEIYNYLKNRPISYENDNAIFVHAGAWCDTQGIWRTDTAIITLWYRGRDFFRKYRGKTIVVGHTPTNKIRYMLGEDLTPSNQMRAWCCNNIIAIDCGAGHDGRLCAVELPSGNLYYQSLES